MSRYNGRGLRIMPTPATTAGFHRMLGSISYSPSVPFANISSGLYAAVPALPECAAISTSKCALVVEACHVQPLSI